MDITLMDETKKLSKKQIEEIDQVLQIAADFLSLEENVEMSVTFMDNQGIQVINRDYRGKDMPTDVISFALEDAGEEELAIIFDEEDEQLPRNLGDIMISVDKAEEQAIDYGHSFQREIAFLAIHGFLHLNGYDHLTTEDEKVMFDLQREILDAYGLKR